MSVADVIGWGGAGFLLLAYAALSRGRLAIGVRYHLMNLTGAAGLAINGAMHRAWPSTVLNLVWLGIGLTGLRHTGARPRRSAPREGESAHPAR
jgi:hypothetical protein